MADILEGLVDKKIKEILTIFIKNKDELFHLQKISQLSKVPISSTFRLIKKLTELGFITVIKINKFKVYKLADNKKTKFLISLIEKNG